MLRIFRNTYPGYLGLAILFILVPVIFWGSFVFIRLFGQETNAVVVSYEVSRSSRYELITYTTTSGETRQKLLPFDFIDYPIGEKLPIQYLVDSALEVVIVRSIWHEMPLIISGIFSLLIARFWLYMGKKTPTEEKEKNS
jgi:glucose uptake protein GlcU